MTEVKDKGSAHKGAWLPTCFCSKGAHFRSTLATAPFRIYAIGKMQLSVILWTIHLSKPDQPQNTHMIHF